MPSQIDTVTEACRLISRQVRESFRQLHVHYIIHHSGQRKEALAVAAQEILNHPAAETALHILQKVRRSEDSAVIGTAVARRKIMFGMASQDTILSLCTINLNQFDNAKDARRYAWHLAWHAIDALQFHGNPDNRNDKPADVILRRRNAIEMAGANLKADAFAGIVSSLNGDLSAIRGLAVMRGMNALQTRSLHNPEFYPYVLAKESTDFVSQGLLRKSLPKKKFIASALKAATDVGRTIDKDALRQWLAFSEPAQDMAWRGYTPDEILTASINTSDDTAVRTIGYLVSEMTGQQLELAAAGQEGYSPFADDAFNERLHEKTIQSIFEDVIGQGMSQRSADPFNRAANTQNESLTEGHILGWCAAALQAAGRTFQRALESGHEPDGAVRREFDGERKTTSWKDLCAIGKDVVHEQRQGNVVTMSRLEQISGDDKAFASIRKAIIATMKDPGYQRRLGAAREAAPEMAGPAPAPAAVLRAAPNAPVPSRAAMPGASMGGRAVSNRSTTISSGLAATRNADRDTTQDDAAQ